MNSDFSIQQKWGFGMAPVKPGVQSQRVFSASLLHDFLISDELLSAARMALLPDAISTLKGLFNRVHRADQWDWFTVWIQLSRPSPNNDAPVIARTLTALRRAVISNDPQAQVTHSRHLRGLKVHEMLGGFVRDEPLKDPAENGYVYILSTRESPELLKIGYTNRDVITRVTEINRATGVLIPFGVRALWSVKDAPGTERRVHDALAIYRVRQDREFFKLSSREAFKVIDQLIG